VLAFQSLYKRLNIQVSIARTAADLADCSRLILPGVGAFDHAMQLLEASGMRATLDQLVLGKGVPVLGICVGMQVIARSSDEGSLTGLGWIDGHVRAFRSLQRDELLLPHMGWNDVTPAAGAKLFSQLETDARFYFLHSYFFDCAYGSNVAAVSRYGIEFCSAVHSRNIHGVQFHPEKSHHFGVQLLKNFAEL